MVQYSLKIKRVDLGQTKMQCLSGRRSQHAVSITEVSEHI